MDEHVWQGLAEVLRLQGYDVVHVNEVGREGLDDADQLAYAAAQGRAIVTFNARHFEPLAAQWFLEGRQHAGMIISNVLPPGELRRRLEHLLRTRSSTELQNTVQWLQAYR